MGYQSAILRITGRKRGFIYANLFYLFDAFEKGARQGARWWVVEKVGVSPEQVEEELVEFAGTVQSLASIYDDILNLLITDFKTALEGFEPGGEPNPQQFASLRHQLRLKRGELEAEISRIAEWRDENADILEPLFAATDLRFFEALDRLLTLLNTLNDRLANLFDAVDEFVALFRHSETSFQGEAPAGWSDSDLNSAAHAESEEELSELLEEHGSSMAEYDQRKAKMETIADGIPPLDDNLHDTAEQMEWYIQEFARRISLSNSLRNLFCFPPDSVLSQFIPSVIEPSLASNSN